MVYNDSVLICLKTTTSTAVTYVMTSSYDFWYVVVFLCLGKEVIYLSEIICLKFNKKLDRCIALGFTDFHHIKSSFLRCGINGK